MTDIVLEREIRGWKGDVNLTKLAVNSVQEEMKEQLMGDMGEDINAVLNGEKIVKIGILEKNKFRFRNWLRKIFRLF